VQANKFILHSGGAIGSDSQWEFTGRNFGLSEFNHYFIEGYKTPRGNASVRISDKLKKLIDSDLKKANKSLKRKYPTSNPYVNNLLRRNWFQVNKSESIFAISKIENDIVSGGTGWAVQMAIDKGIPAFVYCQKTQLWYARDNEKWKECETPRLTENFAGIGTREINDDGIRAIENVYLKTFKE
jgi:hypothetical protein